MSATVLNQYDTDTTDYSGNRDELGYIYVMQPRVPVPVRGSWYDIFRVRIDPMVRLYDENIIERIRRVQRVQSMAQRRRRKRRQWLQRLADE